MKKHQIIRNTLSKLPLVGRIISERYGFLVERNRLIEERDLYVKKSQALESLSTEERKAAKDSVVVFNRRTPRILTQSEAKYYKEKIERIEWFHSLELGNGLSTLGHAKKADLEKRMRSLRIPDDLTGMSFLDVGSWDGYYAFEAEARGASRVLATDYFSWGGGGWGRKDGFLLAREILGSKVEDKNIEVYDVSPATLGMWDIVLFSGIFYHMRDPIRAMQAAASVAAKCMIVETHIDHDDMPEPMMRYVPRDPKHPTSDYWRPNSAMILVLLNEMGFSRVEHRIAFDPPPNPKCAHGFFNAYR